MFTEESRDEEKDDVERGRTLEVKFTERRKNDWKR